MSSVFFNFVRGVKNANNRILKCYYKESAHIGRATTKSKGKRFNDESKEKKAVWRMLVLFFKMNLE